MNSHTLTKHWKKVKKVKNRHGRDYWVWKDDPDVSYSFATGYSGKEKLDGLCRGSQIRDCVEYINCYNKEKTEYGFSTFIQLRHNNNAVLWGPVDL